MMLSRQERTERILSTDYIILLEDSKVLRVDGLHWVGEILFINAEGINYQDTEVITMNEVIDCEKTLAAVNFILNNL